MTKSHDEKRLAEIEAQTDKLYEERRDIKERLERAKIDAFLKSGILSRIAWRLEIHLSDKSRNISWIGIYPRNQNGFERIEGYKPEEVFALLESYHSHVGLVIRDGPTPGYPVNVVTLTGDDGEFYVSFVDMDTFFEFSRKYLSTMNFSDLDKTIADVEQTLAELKGIRGRMVYADALGSITKEASR